MTVIHLSRVHFPVTSLGPGHRVGIWFQGCSIRCRGCISADTWAQNRGETTVTALMDGIAGHLNQADGITITGGEPFDQPEALIDILQHLRQCFKGDIFVYSGYSREQLESTSRISLDLIDALMSDPFDFEAADRLPLRGSDNQRLHLLTDLGRTRFMEYLRPNNIRPPMDVMFDDDGTVWLAGIPRRDDFSRLQTLLNERGCQVVMTDDRKQNRVRSRS